eukprot:1955549-Pleurochrysis_carterae.AAC.1
MACSKPCSYACSIARRCESVRPICERDGDATKFKAATGVQACAREARARTWLKILCNVHTSCAVFTRPVQCSHVLSSVHTSCATFTRPENPTSLALPPATLPFLPSSFSPTILSPLTIPFHHLCTSRRQVCGVCFNNDQECKMHAPCD